MKRKIKFNPNKHQKEFIQDTSSKFLHLSSGFGGGKSFALVMKLFQLSAINKDLPGGILCPSYSDFKRDLLPLIESICDDNKIQYKYHGQDHYFQFEWSKSKVYVVTGNEKIRGPNWAYAVINELTLIPIVRYREVIGRVRIRKAACPQIASCGTPEGTASEYYTFFIESPPARCKIIYGDTRDNAKNLDPSYIETLESSYDKIMLDAYLKGMWINMTGNRFYYSYSPDMNDDPTIKKPDYAVVHIGMDFNVNPMTCSMWIYDGLHLKGFDQIKLQDADTNKMCMAIKARGYDPSSCIVYPDPAGQSRSTKGQPDVEILRQHGFLNIRVKKQAPPLRQRQLNVNNLLSRGVIKINPLTQKDVKKDLEAVEQDPITLDKLKKNPNLTHFSDGLDYLCDILFPYSGTKPQTSQRTIR
jgi:hypothetical protein